MLFGSRGSAGGARRSETRWFSLKSYVFDDFYENLRFSNLLALLVEPRGLKSTGSNESLCLSDLVVEPGVLKSVGFH